MAKSKAIIKEVFVISKKNKLFVTSTVIVITVVLILSIIVFKKINLNDVNSIDITKDTEYSPKLGPENAPNKVIEFLDYKCPYCEKIDSGTFKTLKRKYISKGKVQYRVINASILGKDSIKGSRAAHAINLYYPQKYWDFHHRMFELQSNTKNTSITNTLIDEELKKMNIPKEKLNLIRKSYKTKYSESWNLANRDKELYKKYKNEYVPSIYVNGKFIKNPYSFKEIENKLK
ncbi:DsbA family protein [Staphylococcus epidermidis]|uniref:DsbA family protein n=1 Tax=Staphylococcus epidermidis TaxID=1282 RepID=UPI001A9E8CBD|nr:DsbA family protein [Staphylococcus epidermidis]MBO1577814.1 DsbA family protein [Staphylococcus epidermidis]